MRHYFYAKTLGQVSKLAHACHNIGIHDSHFSVLSKDDIGMYNFSIHPISIEHRHDLFHCASKGSLCGICVGGLIGSILLSMYSLHIAYILGLVVLGAFVGICIGGLTGLNHPNHNLARFDNKVNQGYHLIIIDILQEQQDLLLQLIKYKHVKLEYAGVDNMPLNTSTFLR